MISGPTSSADFYIQLLRGPFVYRTERSDSVYKSPTPRTSPSRLQVHRCHPVEPCQWFLRYVHREPVRRQPMAHLDADANNFCNCMPVCFEETRRGPCSPATYVVSDAHGWDVRARSRRGYPASCLGPWYVDSPPRAVATKSASVLTRRVCNLSRGIGRSMLGK